MKFYHVFHGGILEKKQGHRILQQYLAKHEHEKLYLM